jgi:sugar lactone lactonase YvrE
MSLFLKSIHRVFALGLCSVMLAACGGGSGVSTLRAQPQSKNLGLGAQSAQAAQGNVRFAIAVKAKPKAGVITPKYVSPSTASLQVLTDGANPVSVDLTQNSPQCVSEVAATGTYTCTVSLKVPAGNHDFTVTTYDLAGAKGNVLSTNSTGTVVVKPSGNYTTISIVLEGVVHYVILGLATPNPPVGKPATIGLTALLEDAGRNIIVGAAPFEYPVTLTTTDAVNGPLSKTTLKSPADAAGITVNYSGASVPNITYSATATGMPAASVIPDVLTLNGPAKSQHVFVVDGNVVHVIDTARGNAVLPDISGDGLSDPWAVAVDSAGKLYVANNSEARSVSVFDITRGNAVLPAITGNGLVFPCGAAVDAHGKLFVLDCGDASVHVFDTAHGNAPLPRITASGLSQPGALALDASGKLYVTSSDDNTGIGSVFVFDTAHDDAQLPTITRGVVLGGTGMAIDASGRLYVADDFWKGVGISIFDTKHGNAVLHPITGSGLIIPMGMTIDASGKLYVADDGAVLIFDTAHGNAALPPITYGVPNAAFGVAVY